MNEHVIHMFNEMGYEPPMTGINHFRRYALPTLWNFLFGIFLRCLTGPITVLDKSKLEVFAMIVRLYYGVNVDYVTQLWEEFIQLFHTLMF